MLDVVTALVGTALSSRLVYSVVERDGLDLHGSCRRSQSKTGRHRSCAERTDTDICADETCNVGADAVDVAVPREKVLKRNVHD